MNTYTNIFLNSKEGLFSKYTDLDLTSPNVYYVVRSGINDYPCFMNTYENRFSSRIINKGLFSKYIDLRL